MGAFDDLIPGQGVKPIATAKQRGDALGDYQRAMQLGNVINDIEARFNEGPGATTGLMGLADYLPLPANKAFDSAAGQLRGFVKSTQNMTGGENNTATEARMNIGPFIPESGDYDAVIKQKIAALRRERERGLNTAIATLGGIPDLNGRIRPAMPQAIAALVRSPPPPPSPRAALAAGSATATPANSGWGKATVVK